MSQPMFAKSVGRFLLRKVLARTGPVDLVIDGLAIGLAGNTAFPVHHFHQPIECQRNGFVDPGNIAWKDRFGFVGYL
jgi:hypothetical protein